MGHKKTAINIPAPGLPGGMPQSGHLAQFNCKISDYDALIEKIAGVKKDVFGG